jgi:predicted enzyme related to lactoylglutathione lyase
VIQVKDIAFVGYPIAERARAKDFYEGLLHLKPTMDFDLDGGFFWMEYEVGTGTLALSNYWRAAEKPEQTGPSIAFEVESFDLAVSAIKERGLKFVMDPLETPVCHLAVVNDPDGNSIFIHQRKPGHG